MNREETRRSYDGNAETAQSFRDPKPVVRPKNSDKLPNRISEARRWRPNGHPADTHSLREWSQRFLDVVSELLVGQTLTDKHKRRISCAIDNTTSVLADHFAHD